MLFWMSFFTVSLNKLTFVFLLLIHPNPNNVLGMLSFNNSPLLLFQTDIEPYESPYDKWNTQ